MRGSYNGEGWCPMGEGSRTSDERCSPMTPPPGVFCVVQLLPRGEKIGSAGGNQASA